MKPRIFIAIQYLELGGAEASLMELMNPSTKNVMNKQVKWSEAAHRMYWRL